MKLAPGLKWIIPFLIERPCFLLHTGDTAKQLSERFGKIMQDRESRSINSQDTSISRSKQLTAAVPPSRISGLSSGEFVGMVADDPDNKIELKTFHCEIINDHKALKKRTG